MMLFRFAIVPTLAFCVVGSSGASGLLRHMHDAFDTPAVMLPVLGAARGGVDRNVWPYCGGCALSWNSSARPDKGALGPDLDVSADLWGRIQARLDLAEIHHARIDSELKRYRRAPRGLAEASERSAPFMRYIFEQVSARGMPADIALLPFVESAYRPTAVSSMGAKGLWQLMPATAGRFGLVEDWWFDPRMDLESSTRAALDYLEFLHAKFGGDWLLALAAYNAGEGRVGRAIRNNRKAGLAIDFWHLDLPAETRDYVPRLLAVSRIVSAPHEAGVDLAEIADAPYLEIVELQGAFELSHAAELAGIEIAELKRLNPGLKRSITNPQGTRALVLPSRVSRHFREALAKLPEDSDSVYRKVEYTVRSGDNLWTIAKRFGVSYKNLAGWNDLDIEGILRPGYKLVVWT